MKTVIIGLDPIIRVISASYTFRPVRSTFRRIYRF